MLFEILVVANPVIAEALAPNLSIKSKLFFRFERKTAFNKLHRFFQWNIFRWSYKEVNVIGHNDESVERKSPLFVV